MLAWDLPSDNVKPGIAKQSDVYIITLRLCLVAFQPSPATSEAPCSTPRHDIALPGRLVRSRLSMQQSCHGEKRQDRAGLTVLSWGGVKEMSLVIRAVCAEDKCLFYPPVFL